MRARSRRSSAALVAALALGVVPASAAAAAGPGAISAPSAIVVEASSGDVLFSRASDKPRAIASTTKLMTALLTLERARLAEIVPAARYHALPVESKLGLRAGERLSVADLLRGLMLESANDAAVTLAEHVAGSRADFVRQMNRRARELGLADTRFANPIGLDAPGNRSSARDLARLALELRRHEFIRRIANRTKATLSSGDRPRTVRNRNTLLLAPGAQFVNGLKTGHTLDAGYVLVGSATRAGVTVVSVVLGTDSENARNRDTLALLEWGAGRYERVTPVRRGAPAGAAPIRYRRGATLDLVAGRSFTKTVRKGTRLTTRDVGLPARVSGPIRRGQRFAYREVFADGVRVARVPLVASAAVPEADLAQRVKDWFTRPLALLAALAVLAGSVLLARRVRRRPVTRRPTRSEPEAA